MPTPPIKPEKIRQVLDQFEALKRAGHTVTTAALEMGMARATLSHYVNSYAAKAAAVPRRPADELEIPKGPSSKEPLPDLIERKKAQYVRQQAADEFLNLIPVRVRQPGPVMVCAIGDPHVDDDGCDIGAIERDMTVIGRTEGMYALHVGDITNNWVGRLGRLYAHQSTKAEDGIRLAEWMFDLAPPLAVVGGNHDLWNEGMSWLSFATRQAGVDHTHAHGVRLNLTFPGGKALRIHTRHDFPGHSQYNPLHGLRKEHLFGFRDHINIAGHKHTDSIAGVPSPDGYVQWMVRVSGYKAYDDYAKSGNFAAMKMAPTVGLLIDPNARIPAELVKPFWDLEEGADYLAFKRRRAAA
jgi:hypothetical protein